MARNNLLPPCRAVRKNEFSLERSTVIKILTLRKKRKIEMLDQELEMSN